MKSFFKNLWKGIKKNAKLIIGITVGLILTLLAANAIKKVLGIGKVDKPRNWQPIDENTIVIIGEDGEKNHVMKLPKDPQTGKQIKSKDIESAGISKEGGKLNVEIKHTATNRHILNGG